MQHGRQVYAGHCSPAGRGTGGAPIIRHLLRHRRLPQAMNLLALDTSTDTLSIAVQHGDAVWEHSGPGGPQTSTELIPAILALMAQAGLEFAELQPIVFAPRPASFPAPPPPCPVPPAP